MIERDVPIDGVGMQMHFNDVSNVPSRKAIARIMSKFGTLGLQVHITEMSIDCE
jgi:GH35 family endo-1,4-beta-xylanase